MIASMPRRYAVIIKGTYQVLVNMLYYYLNYHKLHSDLSLSILC